MPEVLDKIKAEELTLKKPSRQRALVEFATFSAQPRSRRDYRSHCLDVPRVRFSISGTKSGANPEPETPRKRSRSKFRISRFRTVGDPETVENTGDSLPRFISELCYPQYGWYPFLFWKGPLHETARAGPEIPNSTGGHLGIAGVISQDARQGPKLVSIKGVSMIRATSASLS